MEFSRDHRKRDDTRKGSACCVANCDSRKNINTNLSFHKVPKFGSGTVTVKNLVGESIVVDKRTEWLKRLKIKDAYQQILVCSLHFSVDDYVFPEIPTQRRYLKTNAVPVPISVSVDKRKSNIKRIQRLNARRNIDAENKTATKADEQSKTEKNKNRSESNTVSNLISPSVSTDVSSDARVKTYNFDSDLFRHYIDAGISVDKMLKNISEPEHHDPVCEGSNVHNDEEHHRHSCNRCQRNTDADQSTKVKSGDLIVSFCTFINTEQDLITMCNIKSFAILDEMVKSMEKCYPPKKERIFKTRECIIFTTAKLKLDLSFAALGVLFNQACLVTLRNIFYDTVKKLATILQSVLTQVSKEEMINNMPKFEKCQDTASVFNCTKIRIQQPKCLKCCSKFYSHYKGGLYVKFMTEVTPGGMIVGVSKEFVSRESVDNKDIACARVHVERMNQRIKQFKILNHELPWYFANYVDDIFIICCGLANFGTPLVADDQFE